LISSPDDVISTRLRHLTRIVLATLTRREQRVLWRRFGIARLGDRPQDHQEDIDDVLTPQQMAFIEATALRKLRHPSYGVRLRSVERR
jgi:RNA polymerase primary sigma factor